MTLNINQFAQQAVRGQLDLQIVKAGILTGKVSENESNDLLVGDDVKIDTAIAVAGGVPQFLKADYNELNDGFIIQDPKASTIDSGMVIQVAMLHYGPVMWLIAAATVTPGAFVEQVDSSTYDVQVQSGGTLRGRSIDYGTVGQLVRIILGAWPVA